MAAPAGRETYGGMLQACCEATGAEAGLVWVDESWSAARGVGERTGSPIRRTPPSAWAMDTRKAQAAGLVCRPLRRTVADTWRWLSEGGTPVAHERFAERGSSPHREDGLLREGAGSR